MIETRVFFFRELEVDFVYVNKQEDFLHEEINGDYVKRDRTVNSLYSNLRNFLVLNIQNPIEYVCQRTV
jgi:hypothetical protein